MNDLTSAKKEKLWSMVQQRIAADFLYAVKTTGVYCRPGCSSRLPNRENVEFFQNAAAAEEKGYRPCKRCKPRQPVTENGDVQMIVAACRMIMEGDSPPRLAELADAAGLSAYHFHRKFKKIIGVTPKQFGAMYQSRQFQDSLKLNATVTEAIYDAGYSSTSRVYENTQKTLAMRPSQFKKGAPGEAIEYGYAKCYLGWVLVAATVRGVCAIELADSRGELYERLSKRFPKARIVAAGEDFSQLLSQVVSHLEEPKTIVDLPLDIQGTAFQKRVWQALLEIPPGITKTYGEVAAMIGRPKAARSVASAVAANRIAVVIPCHRIIRKDGSLGKYRWGKERKRNILETEQHK